MTGYLVNFSVYTLAMIGVMFIGFVIAKKSMSSNCFSGYKNQFLKIDSCLNLEPRKNLYVVKAGLERFLISTDAEKTQFLTKLETANLPSIEECEPKIDHPSFDLNIPILNFTKSFIRKTSIPKNALKTRFVEKLNTYVTFQRP